MLIQFPRMQSEKYSEKHCNMQHLSTPTTQSNSLFQLLLPVPLLSELFRVRAVFVWYVCSYALHNGNPEQTQNLVNDADLALRFYIHFAQWSCSFKSSLKWYPAGSRENCTVVSDDSRCKAASE